MIKNSGARRTARRCSRAALALTFALASGAATGLSAQGHPVGHRVVFGGATNEGIASVSPRSGAVGTLVKIAPAGLPAHTNVWILMGALRSGFEVVLEAMTDGDGRLGGRDTVTVAVPDWVETDRSYLMMVTDTNYNPLAAADMFHPTDANGGVERTGVVKREDPACPTLTADGGEIYFLIGDTHGLVAGKRTIVEGTIVEPGSCGAATTIAVHRARPAPF